MLACAAEKKEEQYEACSPTPSGEKKRKETKRRPKVEKPHAHNRRQGGWTASNAYGCNKMNLK